MLDPLATPDDLEDRGIVIPDGINVDALLASASDAVRDAAGCSISYGASTITLVADGRDLELPGGPVASVDTVTSGETEVAGWTRLAGTVTLPWATVRCPVEITVTYTHGYPVVPADIVDLVCGMVAIAANGDAYGTGNVSASSERLGDYSHAETRAAGSESPSPFTLPDRLRQRLRARFSGTAVTVRA